MSVLNIATVTFICICLRLCIWYGHPHTFYPSVLVRARACTSIRQAQNTSTTRTLMWRSSRQQRVGTLTGCSTTYTRHSAALLYVFWNILSLSPIYVWRHSRDRGSTGRCHDNQFWDYISCKWILTGDNGMSLSYKLQAATLRGSRPGVQSASLIMTSLMTS